VIKPIILPPSVNKIADGLMNLEGSSKTVKIINALD
jgi:hypothetical protein